MNIDKYREALANLPEGVRAAEIYYGSSRSFTAALRDGELERYAVSEKSALSLRADCGKIGYAYTEDPQDDPVRLLNQAKDNAAIIEDPDEQEIFPGAKEYPASPDIDPALTAATAKEKLNVLYALEKAALSADERIDRLGWCQLATKEGETRIVNSLGLDLVQRMGYALAYVSPVATIDGVTKEGAGYRIVRSLEEIDVEAIAKEAAEDLFSQFGAITPASGVYGAVFQREAISALLGVFANMFSAEEAQKGRSLLAGKEGTAIAAPVIDIIDDPMMESALLRHAFDAEGVPAMRTQVVEKGELKTLLHNLKTAKVAGCETTGNAGKASVASPVGVAPSNFHIVPGEDSLDDLLKKLRNGVLIVEVSGLHAGCNPVSGAFSAMARGFMVKDGKKAEPVEQITVSGNFLDLMKNITAVGNDLKFDLDSLNIAAPSVLVSAVTVAGK
ncbi:MAG: TldD/PmbA family protein [Christensenellales bacterium]|jgi:PmbA protein